MRNRSSLNRTVIPSILLFSIGLKVFHLNKTLWYDEMTVAVRDVFNRSFLSYLLHPGDHYFQTLFVKALYSIPGAGRILFQWEHVEIIFRLLPFASAVATPFVLAKLCEEVLDLKVLRTRILLLFGLSSSALINWYAHDSRSYVFVLLLGSINALYYFRIGNRKPIFRGDIFGFVVASLLGIIHFVPFFLLVFAQTVVLLCIRVKDIRLRNGIIILSMIIIMAGGLGLMMYNGYLLRPEYFRIQFPPSELFFRPAFVFFSRLFFLLVLGPVRILSLHQYPFDMFTGYRNLTADEWFAVFTVLGLVGFSLARFSRKVLLALAIFPLVFLALYGANIFVAFPSSERYFVFLFPFLLILTLQGLLAVSKHRIPVVLTLSIILGVNFKLVVLSHVHGTAQTPDWKAAREYFRDISGIGHTPGISQAQLIYTSNQVNVDRSVVDHPWNKNNLLFSLHPLQTDMNVYFNGFNFSSDNSGKSDFCREIPGGTVWFLFAGGLFYGEPPEVVSLNSRLMDHIFQNAILTHTFSGPPGGILEIWKIDCRTWSFK